MPRSPRIDAPGTRHHVVNRGARHDPMFLDDLCCARFVDLLAELTERYGLVLHGFTVMPNHYHLLVESRSGRLSQGIGYLQREYSRWLNHRYDWDGPVLRGRFRNRVVEDEAYWRHLLAYIHLNPVRANVVTSPDRANWTSHTAYVGLAPRPEWLVCAELLELHGGVEAYQQYVRQLQFKAPVGPETYDPDGIWSGAESGVVRGRVDAAARARSPQPRWAEPDEGPRIEPALREIEEATGLSREDLLRVVRGRRGNRGRWLVSWWLTWGGRVSGTRVAELLGVKRSGVSQMAARARRQRADDEYLDEVMSALERLHQAT